MTNRVSVRVYGRGDRLYVQAQRIWIILASFVSTPLRKTGDQTTITYGDLAEKMGYDRRAAITLSRQLGIVGDCCLSNDLPALNAIVVSEATGLPGPEVVLRPNRSVKQEQNSVHKRDWCAMSVPSTGALRKIWEQS